MLFSRERCVSLFNAVTKVIYSVLRAKYTDVGNSKSRSKKLPDDENSTVVVMQKLCSDLDAAEIARIMLSLLSKNYINAHNRYVMKEEISVSLVLRFLNLNG